MANPLQPKVINCLETHYSAYVINLIASAKSGDADLIACIKGEFWAFEVKWASDTPSELQRIKINNVIDAGGRAYFIRSVEELCKIIDNKVEPTKYKLKTHFDL